MAMIIRSYAGCPPGWDHRNPEGQRSNMNGRIRTRKAAVASNIARSSIRRVSPLILPPVLRPSERSAADLPADGGQLGRDQWLRQAPVPTRDAAQLWQADARNRGWATA